MLDCIVSGGPMLFVVTKFFFEKRIHSFGQPLMTLQQRLLGLEVVISTASQGSTSLSPVNDEWLWPRSGWCWRGCWWILLNTWSSVKRHAFCIKWPYNQSSMVNSIWYIVELVQWRAWVRFPIKVQNLLPIWMNYATWQLAGVTSCAGSLQSRLQVMQVMGFNKYSDCLCKSFDC